MRRSAFIIGIAGLVALCSCSVKEDRSDCPCWITVTAKESTSISAWYGSQRILDNHSGGLVDHTVPRGVIDIVASEGSFTAPEGQQMGELFAQLQHLDTDGEFASAGIELKKQFAVVSVEYKDADDGRIDMQMEVVGTVCGSDKRTLQPKEGSFRCQMEDAPERGYRFRAPRQKDNSLIINRYAADGEMLDSIPLGELISKAGFDWTRESLGDVHILADIPAHTFTISVMEWDGPVIINITI